MIKSFEEFHGLNESNSKFRSTPIDRKLTKLVDTANGFSTPFVLMAISNKKIVNAVVIRDHKELVPQYREMVKKHPKAEIHVEDHDGQNLPPVYEDFIQESTDMLPSYEVIAGLAAALGALDLAQAARGGKSIVLDVAKLLRAELGTAVEATGARVRAVVDKYKRDPKVKEIIQNADRQVSESL